MVNFHLTESDDVHHATTRQTIVHPKFLWPAQKNSPCLPSPEDEALPKTPEPEAGMQTAKASA
jgi:hypothetical protein